MKPLISTLIIAFCLSLSLSALALANQTAVSSSTGQSYHESFWTNKQGGIMNAELIGIERTSNGTIQSVVFEIKGKELIANWDELSQESQEQALALETKRAKEALKNWKNKNTPKQESTNNSIANVTSEGAANQTSFFDNIVLKIKSFFTKEKTTSTKEFTESTKSIEPSKKTSIVGTANQFIAKARDNIADINNKQQNVTSNSVYINSLNNDMLRLQNGNIKPAPNSAKPAYIAIYYSAHWCPPCRQFTPKLVNFYNQNKGNNFELIFVSSDQSQTEMNQYIKGYKMPWLVLPYSKARSHSLWSQFSGRGIPCLVVINSSNGEVISHSYDGNNYIGPTKVMSDLQQLISKKP